VDARVADTSRSEEKLHNGVSFVYVSRPALVLGGMGRFRNGWSGDVPCLVRLSSSALLLKAEHMPNCKTFIYSTFEAKFRPATGVRFQVDNDVSTRLDAVEGLDNPGTLFPNQGQGPPPRRALRTACP
jgi:hypothetical protein